jgi:hypothetical protein
MKEKIELIAAGTSFKFYIFTKTITRFENNTERTTGKTNHTAVSTPIAGE